jgi:hypothetical protein
LMPSPMIVTLAIPDPIKCRFEDPQTTCPTPVLNGIFRPPRA